VTSESGVGVVSGLWRFPIKSMGGERLQAAEISTHGLLGDRAYALIDADTGKVVSAKSVRRFPGILDCHAAFVEAPVVGRDLPPVRITVPGGASVTSDSPDVDLVLSTHFGRAVRLARAAPDDYTIDQYHPDIEDVDPAGHRDTVVDQKLGSAFFAQAGMPSPVPAGAFVDLFPISVLTTGTLAHLSALEPASRFDQRRFRMNVIVETTGTGLVENAWIGHAIALGTAARLRVTLPDPRCVMTTLPQDGLDNDPGVLRALLQHNRMDVAGARYPCAGVYAVVETPGSLRIGDAVRLVAN